MLMHLKRISKGVSRRLVLASLLAFIAPSAAGAPTTPPAVTSPASGRLKAPSLKSELWLYDLTELRFSKPLPLRDAVEAVEVPIGKIRARVSLSSKDETVEPVFLPLNLKASALRSIVERYAKPDKTEQLHEVLRRYLSSLSSLENTAELSGDPLPPYPRIKVDEALLELINEDALLANFVSTHHRLTLPVKDLQQDPVNLARLFEELSPYFSNAQFAALEEKLLISKEIVLDEELLPRFARKMVKNFVIHRGPNCFHASLAFQNPSLTRSQFYNVKREKGYHPAMINYDELWRILQRNFYEINARRTSLKYGDIFVFFDAPPALAEEAVDFKWIRHTATYLFNSYSFSKGSKSPNSAYTVKTLAEEWSLWRRLNKNFAVKIFRLSSKNVKRRPPQDLIDWIY